MIKKTRYRVIVQDDESRELIQVHAPHYGRIGLEGGLSDIVLVRTTYQYRVRDRVANQPGVRKDYEGVLKGG